MSKTTVTQFAEEREQIIMNFLQSQGKIRVSEVIDLLGISPSTARLLLQKMDDKGMLLRTHGGAVMINQSPPPKYQRDFGNIENQEKKLQIAAAAAQTVNDGDFIALGSGTTTFLMSTMLHDKQDLTIVTDSIPVAYELIGDEQITLYICGGWIMHRNSACRGVNAENFLKSLSVDKSYCGTDSIHPEFGMTSVDFDPRTEALVGRIGKERYVLADSSKFCVRPYINKVADISEIGHVISDASLAAEYITALEDAGVDVIIGESGNFAGNIEKS